MVDCCGNATSAAPFGKVAARGSVDELYDFVQDDYTCQIPIGSAQIIVMSQSSLRHIYKPKLPRSLAYVIKSSELEAALGSYARLIDVTYWRLNAEKAFRVLRASCLNATCHFLEVLLRD